MTHHLEKIISQFNKLPPNREEIEKDFKENNYNAQEIAEIAVEILGECFAEYIYAQNNGIKDINELHSMYIYDSMQYLIENGLNPNTIVNEDGMNPMDEALGIDMPGIGPKVLRLLLENGGNPNLLPNDTPETLFEYVTFEINEESDVCKDINRFHCWILLMAYGGCWRNGEIPLEMLNNHDVSLFKEFERFDYYMEWIPRPGFRPEWRMHIYDTEAEEVVAVY